jgi:hypothetical protein
MLMTILKFLAMWLMVSIAAALYIGPFLKRLREDQSELDFMEANRLPPLPSGSIDRDGLAQ